MSFTGVNRLCAQCVKGCKQFSQVSVVYCPSFESTQSGYIKPKDGHTLPLEENQLEANSEAILES